MTETPDDQGPASTPPADDTTPAADDTTPATRPSGSPSAAAARRARRIGGRPGGAARSDPGAAEPAAPSTEPAEPAQPAEPASVSLGKQDSPQPAEQPGEAAAAAVSYGLPAQFDPDSGEPRTVVVTAIPAWLNWAPAAVLGLGALVLAILLVIFSHSVWWGPSPKSVPAKMSTPYLRDQVLAAAKNCVATTNTYEYTALDVYEGQALACTTGQFTSQLKDTIEQLIKVNAPKLKSSQHCQINRGGIEAVSPDGKQWTILLFGQLSVTNTQNKQPRTDPFAAQVRMDKVNGKWLIGALTTVSTPLS